MPAQNPLLEYLNAIFRYPLVIVCTLLVGCTLTVWTVRILPNIYQSTTLIMVEPQDVPQAFVMSTVTTRLEERLNSLNQEVLSRTRLEAIITDFDLFSDLRKQGVPRERIVESMRKHIQIEVFARDNAFRISYQGEAPEVVQRVTARLASMYIDENLKNREQHVTGTAEFLENELQKARREIEKQDAQIQSFKQAHMGELPEQQDANIRALEGLRVQLQTISLALSAAKERKLLLSKQADESRAPRPATPGDHTVSAASPHTRLRELEALLTDLRGRYTAEHPDVISTQHKIAQLQADLSARGGTDSAADPSLPPELLRALAEVNLEISRLKATEDDAEKAVAMYQARVENTFPNQQQLLNLTRDYSVTQKEYQTMLDKKLDAQLAQSLEQRQKGERFRILDPANLSETPIKPNRQMLAMAGFGGSALLALALPILLGQLDTSLHAADELAGYGLPVLAVIPQAPTLDIARRRRRYRLRVVGLTCLGLIVGLSGVSLYAKYIF